MCHMWLVVRELFVVMVLGRHINDEFRSIRVYLPRTSAVMAKLYAYVGLVVRENEFVRVHYVEYTLSGQILVGELPFHVTWHVPKVKQVRRVLMRVVDAQVAAADVLCD